MKRFVILLLFVCCSLLNKAEGKLAFGMRPGESDSFAALPEKATVSPPASLVFFDAAPHHGGTEHQTFVSLEQEDEDELSKKDSLLLKLCATLLVTFLWAAWLKGRRFQNQPFIVPFFADSGRYRRLRTFRI